MQLITTLTIIFGIAMSLGHFPQAYTMLKNKTGKNVSLLAYSIFATGTTIWFIYGLMKHDTAIITSYAPGLIGAWLVLYLRIYYGQK
jgi:MtN3 and saliva related transmembrane protein